MHGQLRYKGISTGILGLPVAKKYTRKSRIKKYDRKRSLYNATFASPFSKQSPKNLIIMYDIPNFQKRERDWFRRQLMHFGYIMIQKSVWVGPSPLPKDFLKYLKEIKIESNFKTFKLAKAYQDTSKAISKLNK